MLQFLHPSNPLMDSQNPPRGSTSQMCLHKILTIINTVPPPVAASASKESSAEDEKKVSGFVQVVDGFCISKEVSKEDDRGQSSSSTTGSSAAGFNHDNGGDRVNSKEGGDMVSENSHIEIEGTERNMTLLIEAAELIFGEFRDDDGDKSDSRKRDVSRSSEVKKDEVAAEIDSSERKLGRRSSCWAAAETGGDFEEPPLSPVVRSKRGRTQVLPGKFRDSVLEPLSRFSRTRSSIIPSKRARR